MEVVSGIIPLLVLLSLPILLYIKKRNNKSFLIHSILGSAIVGVLFTFTLRSFMVERVGFFQTTFLIIASILYFLIVQSVVFLFHLYLLQKITAQKIAAIITIAFLSLSLLPLTGSFTLFYKQASSSQHLLLNLIAFAYCLVFALICAPKFADS